MYYYTGLPGWMRFGYSPEWVGRSPTGLPPTAQYLMQTGQVPQPMPPAQTVAPTHENCVYFKDGFCTLYGVQVDSNTSICPNFTPKNFDLTQTLSAQPLPPMFASFQSVQVPQPPKEQEVQMLEGQAKMIEQQLEQIKKRLEALGKT